MTEDKFGDVLYGGPSERGSGMKHKQYEFERNHETHTNIYLIYYYYDDDYYCFEILNFFIENSRVFFLISYNITICTLVGCHMFQTDLF